MSVSLRTTVIQVEISSFDIFAVTVFKIVSTLPSYQELLVFILETMAAVILQHRQVHNMKLHDKLLGKYLISSHQ